jgi:hypothetical protein
MKLLVRKNLAKIKDEDPDYIVTQKQRSEDDTGYVMVQVGTGYKEDYPSNNEVAEKYILLNVEITKSTYARK